MTFVTVLLKSGVSLPEAQRLARHNNPKLTAAVYTYITMVDKTARVSALPSLRATGDEQAKPARLAAGAEETRPGNGTDSLCPRLCPAVLKTGHNGAIPRNLDGTAPKMENDEKGQKNGGFTGLLNGGRSRVRTGGLLLVRQAL